MTDVFEIITVNYNTPDLLEKLIESIRKYEGDYQIRVIDGSDKEPFISQAKDVVNKFTNITIEPQGWNIHHGRGMDLGITTSKFKFVLFMDTDVHLLKSGLFDMFDLKFKINGFAEHMDIRGINIEKSENSIKYIHPRFMLFNTKFYNDNKNVCRFIHHGSPAIQLMKTYHDEGIIDKISVCLAEKYGINKYDYIPRDGRGTVNRFGYSL